MKYLSEEKIENKKILLRCDFNVPIHNGIITDSSKIDKSLKTINYLLKNNNKVIIFSHFGRVKVEEDKKNNSLKKVYEYLKNIIDLEFIEDSLNLDIVNNSDKLCFLVENTRFTDIPNKKESINDLELAKYWASFGDIFVVDAFASLHRMHASTAGISKYLPTYLGFLVEDEIKNLDPLINNKDKKLLVIMGGAKVDDKIKIIENILPKCDKLLLTGGLLNTFLKVKGYNVGNSLVSSDEEVLKIVKKLLEENKDKIIYSNCFIVKREDKNVCVSIEDVQSNDIILDNIITEKDISYGELIFLNGSCGKFEEKEYEEGTKKLLELLKKSNASVYIGGGDAVASTHKFGYTSSFTYTSSGGGATLEYVSTGKLNALEFIKENSVEN